MKTAAVIGANGFLGGAIVNKLIDSNIEVFAVYNTNYNKINSKAVLISSDNFLQSSHNPDSIFYVVGNYTNSHIELLEINDTLYQYSKKFKDTKFIYISSTNVYGLHDLPITEQSAFNNPSNYALSKIAGEYIVQSIQNYSIARLTYIYGSGITNNSFLPQIIKSAKELGKIQLFGEGERKQDYLFIDDAVDFCIKISEIKENKIFLGATGTSTTNKEIAEQVCNNIDCEILYKDIDFGQSFIFDPKITQQLINWKPKTTIQEGIKKMIAF